jgi:hypothetical protein
MGASRSSGGAASRSGKSADLALQKQELQFTSMEVTLRAGSVMVKEEPLAGKVPIGTGWTGFWPAAEAAVI